MGFDQLLLQEQDLLGLDLVGVLAGVRLPGPVRLHDVLYGVQDAGLVGLCSSETGRVAQAVLPAVGLLGPVLVEGVLVGSLAIAQLLVVLRI